MGEVVNFQRVFYAEHEDYLMQNNKLIGMISNYNDLEVICNDGIFQIKCHEMFANFENRERLAGFLWMAVRMIDSEGRYEAEKYVGLDYDMQLS